MSPLLLLKVHRRLLCSSWHIKGTLLHQKKELLEIMEAQDIGFSDTLTTPRIAGKALLLGLVDVLLCHLQSKDQFLLFLL